jgi:hypothetical protein
MHDGRMHDGRMHDGRMHDGRVYGGRMHGGRMHGGRCSSGAARCWFLGGYLEEIKLPWRSVRVFVLTEVKLAGGLTSYLWVQAPIYT